MKKICINFNKIVSNAKSFFFARKLQGKISPVSHLYKTVANKNNLLSFWQKNFL